MYAGVHALTYRFDSWRKRQFVSYTSHGESVVRGLDAVPQGFCGNRLFPADLDKLDNEKKELIQSDIAALHQFYSKHLDFPDHSSLVVLFAQVRVPASRKTFPQQP